MIQSIMIKETVVCCGVKSTMMSKSFVIVKVKQTLETLTSVTQPNSTKNKTSIELNQLL